MKLVGNFRNASSLLQQQSAPPHSRGRTSRIRSAAYRILYSGIPPHFSCPPCYTHHSPWPASRGRSNKSRGGVSPRAFDKITPPKDRRLCTRYGSAPSGEDLRTVRTTQQHAALGAHGCLPACLAVHPCTQVTPFHSAGHNYVHVEGVSAYERPARARRWKCAQEVGGLLHRT